MVEQHTMNMGAGPQASLDSSILLDGRHFSRADMENGGTLGPCVGWILYVTNV